MRRRNHFSISFATSFWIFYFIFENNIIFTFINSFLVALISWLPDIDISFEHKLKNLNRKSLYLLYPITLPFRLLFRHRTITHSIWLPVILFYLAEFFLEEIWFIFPLRIFYIAILLHIIEDAFTKSGIKLFFPIPLKIRLSNLSVNSSIDFIILEIFSYIILLSFFGMLFMINSRLI